MTETEYEKIIQQKEENYKEYLPKIKLNNKIVDILIRFLRPIKLFWLLIVVRIERE
jgi:hypothetical protein